LGRDLVQKADGWQRKRTTKRRVAGSGRKKAFFNAKGHGARGGGGTAFLKGKGGGDGDDAIPDIRHWRNGGKKKSTGVEQGSWKATQGTSCKEGTFGHLYSWRGGILIPRLVIAYLK